MTMIIIYYLIIIKIIINMCQALSKLKVPKWHMLLEHLHALLSQVKLKLESCDIPQVIDL